VTACHNGTVGEGKRVLRKSAGVEKQRGSEREPVGLLYEFPPEGLTKDVASLERIEKEQTKRSYYS